MPHSISRPLNGYYEYYCQGCDEEGNAQYMYSRVRYNDTFPHVCDYCPSNSFWVLVNNKPDFEATAKKLYELRLK